MRCHAKCVNQSRICDRSFASDLLADDVDAIRFSELHVTKSMEVLTVHEGDEKKVCEDTF